ncbi:polyketide synthase [Penicillium angulare]|uniref:Polyketide synthase n=1 Tax=Penicillium angulare TaxID=116970 RepID=A0A9W9JSZ8_9EURO|nr:polyketide synthase [Penicillium angulare]
MNTKDLIHQVSWTPVSLLEKPLVLQKVVFLVGDRETNFYQSCYLEQAAKAGLGVAVVNDASQLESLMVPGTVVAHIPHLAVYKTGIYDAAIKSCTSLIAAAQAIQRLNQIQSQQDTATAHKLVSICTMNSNVNDLGFAPLRGLARVLKMEIPGIFSGLFEQDTDSFPLSIIRDAWDFDVVRILDGVPLTASLQSVPENGSQKEELELDPNATYLITGGTKGMGLEIATWMYERGARNLLLVSRHGLSRDLDPGKKNQDADHEKLVSRISQLSDRGARAHVLAIEIAQPGAESNLGQAIKDLNIPPVKGIVHGAGIAGYHTLQSCTDSNVAEILAPKLVGALVLDKLFPPGQLDFFFLASSIGQLVGFPGQLSYAAANSFLDGFAEYRRRQGDQCTSIQWGSWRDVGLMAQSKSAIRMINKGMQSAGIAVIEKEEALLSLQRIAGLEIDNAAVVRVLELQPGELPRHPMLKNVTPYPEPQNLNSSFNNYPEHAIAVVGMACRTAAGDTLEDFWQVIQDGRSMARDMNSERFPDVPKGRMWGNFLSEIDSFDHQFFKKSKREASALDPHQRLLLQTTYHALESAGVFGAGKEQKPESYDRLMNDNTTGCFIGMNAPDYPLNLACHTPSPYSALGMLRSFVSGRLSHYFGWTGPSHIVDTACSSAMVAIHQACRAIQLGECTRAVAGGINLITNTVLSEALRAGGFTNQTGPCKTFDSRADGYCRGEAVGVVVLKSLKKALKDGDDIQGVLLGTATNQNVNYTTITNTVLESQVALYGEVLGRAGIKPCDLSYVEAHGTGTRSGDPIEIAAIRQALGVGENGRPHPLHIGATKPNVGHAEGASGVVSLIKVLLMLKHGKIPPQAQFQNLNPNIAPLEPDGLAISKSLQNWDDGMRLALVNNAGASGNNAFAVLAPAPTPTQSRNLYADSSVPSSVNNLSPIFISASSKSSLTAYCEKLANQIHSGQVAPGSLSHVAYALASRQNRQFLHTFCTTAASLDDLKAQLSRPEAHIVASPKPKPIVLMFSGQNGDTISGSQAIYDSSKCFRKYLHQCDDMMQSLGLPSLLPAALQGIQGEADLAIRHAATIAIQYASGMAWIDSGAIPEAVCGHSLGEWTAMAISGVISIEACMRLVDSRASLIQKLWGPDKGSMIVVEIDSAVDMTPNRHLGSFQDEYPETKLEIACYNGPKNYVAAGYTSDIETFESYLSQKKATGEKVRYKVMKGMHAYHCVLVDSILPESGKLSGSVKFQVCDETIWTRPTTYFHPKQEPTIPFETCHEGSWNSPGGDIIARNTRGSVFFTQAISRIVSRLGPCTFLEAGVGGPITQMTRNALQNSQSQHKFLAISAKDQLRSLTEATACLWKDGHCKVQFWPFHREERLNYTPVSLPSYQFDRSKHWVEQTGLGGPKEAKPDREQPTNQPTTCPNCLKTATESPYITLEHSKSNNTRQFMFNIDTRSRRYQDLVGGHIVVGSPICPAGMYLELASHAVTLLPDMAKTSTPCQIQSEKLDIKSPLGLDAQRTVQLCLTAEARNIWAFELSSTRANGKSDLHATGTIRVRNGNETISDAADERAIWDRVSNLLDDDEDTESLRGKMVYKVFGKMAKYSPPYKGIKYLVGKVSEGAGDIKMPVQGLDAAAKSPNDSITDPVLMDNFLQVPGAFVHSLRNNEEEAEDGTSWICNGMGRVGPLSDLRGSGEYRVYTQILREDSKQILLDVFVFDKQNKRMIWSSKNLVFARAPRKSLSKIVAAASPDVAAGVDQQIIEPTAPAPAPPKIPESSTSLQLKSVPIRSPPLKSKENSINVFAGVQAVLSESLEVGIEEIHNDTTLEDLGADSLVGSEILAGVTTKFDIEIPMDVFMTATNVISVCNLISDRLGIQPIDHAEENKDESLVDGKPPPLVLDGFSNTQPLETQKTIFDILSRSLDLNISEIEMDSRMEDLGADSLVAAEIVSNLNDALDLNTSPTDFAAVEDVRSLCEFVFATMGINTTTNHSSSSSDNSSASPVSTPISTDYEPMSPTTDIKEQPVPQLDSMSIWGSFQKTRRNFDSHAKENNLTGFWDHVYPQQLTAVAAFIVEAFEKLGCPIRTLTQGEIIPKLQETLPQWDREVPRLWEILEEAAIVKKTGREIVRGSACIENTGDQLTAKLIADFPQYKASHGLLHLIGPHLADCLTGKADPVSILFGSAEGRNLLGDYYAHAPDLRTATNVLCDFFSAAIQAWSSTSNGEPIHILEIGGGTGGTTKHLVPVLEATGLPFTYTFSEISASLLARAKRTTFKNFPGMEFRKVNIEEDPAEGLLGKYHIVLSTNCIHATHSLEKSLANIRKLVRPDGCVALVEATQRIAWYDLVWGLLDGWWMFNDDRTYPLQGPWEWERAMQAAGFAQVSWSESTSRESRDLRVICGMAEEVLQPIPTKATSMVMHRGAVSTDRSLFLIPDGFGSGAVFGSLQPLLDRVTDFSIYALNSPFLRKIPNPNQQPSVEEMAGIYVAEIKRRQPKGPYFVGGYSIGGVVAFEVTRQLLEGHNEVEKLFLIDTISPTLGTHLPDTVVDFVNSIGRVGMVNEHEIREKSKGRPITTDHFTFARQQLMNYQPSKLPGTKIPQAVLVSAKEGVDKQGVILRPVVLPQDQDMADWFLDDRCDDETFGWGELLGKGNMSVIRADGNHFSLMLPPHVHGWGSAFVDLLHVV